MVTAFNLKFDQLVEKSKALVAPTEVGGLIPTKCKRFFKYNEVLELEKVGIASIHLEGKTLDWFQGYEASIKDLNWETLATDITTQFWAYHKIEANLSHTHLSRTI